MKVRSEADKAFQRRFLLRLAATDGFVYSPEVEDLVLKEADMPCKGRKTKAKGEQRRSRRAVVIGRGKKAPKSRGRK